MRSAPRRRISGGGQEGWKKGATAAQSEGRATKGRNQRGHNELRRTRDGEKMITTVREEKKRRKAGRKCAAVSCRSPGSNTGQVGGFWVTSRAGMGKLWPGGPYAAS